VVTRFKFKEEEIRFSWRRHGLRPRGAGFLQVRFGETQPDRPRMPSVPTPERRLHIATVPRGAAYVVATAYQRWDS